MRSVRRFDAQRPETKEEKSQIIGVYMSQPPIQGLQGCTMMAFPSQWVAHRLIRGHERYPAFSLS